MKTQEPGPTVLFFYAYALTLCALLLGRDIPSQDAITEASALAMLAWLLINRRWLSEG
jgi:hypothetical protein